MTKPDKPLEAQGLGCGLVISVTAMAIFFAWLGLPPAAAIWVSAGLAAVSLIVYLANQFKAQRILDAEYKALIARQGPTTPTEISVSPIDGEGRYKIVGVDRATGMDTTWHTTAMSTANAKVKGELEGIIVTEVTKL